MMSQVDIGWLAGLIEGEGCVHRKRNFKPKYPLSKYAPSPIIAVQMVDEDIIRRLAEVTGVGNIRGPYCSKTALGKQPRWDWRVAKKRDVARLLLAIYPLLGQRRREQTAALVRECYSRG